MLTELPWVLDFKTKEKVERSRKNGRNEKGSARKAAYR